jgi:hypothetical protein
MEQSNDTETVSLTTADYIKVHLLDRVRHLEKSEPTLTAPLNKSTHHNDRDFLKFSSPD